MFLVINLLSQLLDPIREFYNLTIGGDSPIAPGKYAACGWYQRKNWLEVVSDKYYGLFAASIDAAVKVWHYCYY